MASGSRVCFYSNRSIWIHIQYICIIYNNKRRRSLNPPRNIGMMNESDVYIHGDRYPLVMTLTVCHGQIHHAIKFGKPSFSIKAIYTMAMLKNQMVLYITIKPIDNDK